MGSQGVKFEGSLETRQVISFLDDLVKGLRDGRICVQERDRFVVLSPVDVINVEIEAEQKKGVESLSIELTWAQKNGQADGSLLKISFKEPTAEGVKVKEEKSVDRNDPKEQEEERKKAEAKEAEKLAKEEKERLEKEEKKRKKEEEKVAKKAEEELAKKLKAEEKARKEEEKRLEAEAKEREKKEGLRRQKEAQKLAKQEEREKAVHAKKQARDKAMMEKRVSKAQEFAGSLKQGRPKRAL